MKTLILILAGMIITWILFTSCSQLHYIDDFHNARQLYQQPDSAIFEINKPEKA